jgi:16S rRNA (uracil1498-N3)-methyltransferase
MTRPVFYATPADISPHGICLRGDEVHHLTKVMRLSPGDDIVVVDGKGTWYEATVRQVGRDSVECAIVAENKGAGEPAVRIILGVALLKNPAKFDFLVEKSVELGVDTIVPLQTSRTIPSHARETRWQQIALAAMKQSCRSLLTTVRPLTPFASFLSEQSPSSLLLLPHEETTTPTMQQVLRHHGRSTIAVCIGPEGGFTPAEVTESTTAGFIPVTLGNRRLRTETAAMLSVGLCSQIS